MVAQLIKEFLEFYRMDYSLSVYLPEVSMQNESQVNREDLAKKMDI
jgi:hypothetical protein